MTNITEIQSNTAIFICFHVRLKYKIINYTKNEWNNGVFIGLNDPLWYDYKNDFNNIVANNVIVMQCSMWLSIEIEQKINGFMGFIQQLSHISIIYHKIQSNNNGFIGLNNELC